MSVATLSGNRSVNMAMSHPDSVDMWENGGGGLFITTPGCEVVLANLQLNQGGKFAEDAANLTDWSEEWINQAGGEVFSVPMKEFGRDVDSGVVKLVATWIPAYDGSYVYYVNDTPELWLCAHPGRAAERYLGIDAEDFVGGEYPMWIE